MCRCHLGKTILYDTVSTLSWSVDIRTHGIVSVIENILSQPWPPSVNDGREVPKPKPENDCVVSGYLVRAGNGCLELGPPGML